MASGYIQVICSNGHYAEHPLPAAEIRCCPTCSALPGWSNIVTAEGDAIAVSVLEKFLGVMDGAYVLPTPSQVEELAKLRGT